MKAALIFPGTGPILILTTFPSLTDEGFIEKLAHKGITKFIGFEVALESAKAKYGNRFKLVEEDLGSSLDMRVLDYNGHSAFHNFSFGELGEPVKFES